MKRACSLLATVTGGLGRGEPHILVGTTQRLDELRCGQSPTDRLSVERAVNGQRPAALNSITTPADGAQLFD